MNKALGLTFTAALILSGCSISRVQTEAGEMSIENSTFYSNTALVYNKNKLGVCAIPQAKQNESGAFSVPIEDLNAETSVVCTNNQTQTAQRDITPLLWKTKYDKAHRSAQVSSFIFGGPLGLAVNAAVTTRNPKIEDVGVMHRIYPPYMAVLAENASDKEKAIMLKMLDESYAAYLQNLPKDCDNWNQREFNALCSSIMIDVLKQHEQAYINGTEFEMPEDLEPAKLEGEDEERSEPNS